MPPATSQPVTREVRRRAGPVPLQCTPEIRSKCARTSGAQEGWYETFGRRPGGDRSRKEALEWAQSGPEESLSSSR
jgi:hypothetical protein